MTETSKGSDPLTSIRPIAPPPPVFDGTLAELYRTHILSVLPDVAEVGHIHHRLVAYAAEVDPIFLVRLVKDCVRGQVYTTDSGARFKPTDNSPAWWMHHLAFNRIRNFDVDDAPSHMFEVGQRMATNISSAGWHVAHILNAKDRHVDFRRWTRDGLVKRFIRNVHPANCFYIPKNGWPGHGSNPQVIGFFAARYRERFHAIWNEFEQLSQGGAMAFSSGNDVPYAYSLAKTSGTAAGRPVSSSYSYSRLCFKADVIDPLDPKDVFEVITPVGTFRMTKAEFEAEFPNVVTSKSYRTSRIYHFPKVPSRALPFLVNKQNKE